MLFRYNNRSKIGTFLHELSHRLVLEYDLYNKSKDAFEFTDIHQLIDLFLFDALCANVREIRRGVSSGVRKRVS